MAYPRRMNILNDYVVKIVNVNCIVNFMVSVYTIVPDVKNLVFI